MDNLIELGNVTDRGVTIITNCLNNLKRLEDEKKTIMSALKDAMEQNNIRSIENDILSITYVDAYDRETLDSKLLKKELPDVYDDFARITTVAPSVKVKVK